jgi:hypothetical protein
MAEGPRRDAEGEALEHGLSTLLHALACEPVSDRIAGLAAELQRALEQRRAQERPPGPR